MNVLLGFLSRLLFNDLSVVFCVERAALAKAALAKAKRL
jgi:hypothetical protein